MIKLIEFRGLKVPEAILAERQRQVSVEGWTPEHDDEHGDGSMLTVARLYWLHAFAAGAVPRRRIVGQRAVPRDWPWDDRWWKPKTPRRDLERAGALCLAEAERLRRANPGCDLEEVRNALKAIITTLQGAALDG